MTSWVVRAREDRGSIMPLLIGGCALALALVLGVTTATSLYLERKRLLSVADGAALVAAESFDYTSVPSFDAGGRVHPTVTSATVTAGARDYFATLPPGSSYGATLISATTPDAHTAVVRVRAFWQPPLLSHFFPTGFALEVESSARAGAGG